MACAVQAPRIVVNAKVYPEVTGADGALRLAQACAAAAAEAGTVIGLAPPLVELAGLGRRRDLQGVRLFAQHVDGTPPGAGTGWVTAEAVRAAGATGTLLNHAEHKLPHEPLRAAFARAREAGLATLLCADSQAETEALALLAPTYLAVEPPELIGGDVSVTSADPRIVSAAADAVRRLSPRTLPLCGAGVKTGRDVAAALELGAHGVLLASGVVKAPDPLAALRDLCAGLP